MKTKHKHLTGRAIDAMTPSQRQKIIDEIDRSTPGQRTDRATPPTPAERARLDRAAKRMGRPRPPQPIANLR